MEQPISTSIRDYHRGTSIRAYEFLGCHPESRDGSEGFVFRVWAPNAHSVSVVGDFNFWNPSDLPMRKISQGIWEAWSSHAREGQAYKYLVRGWSGTTVYKADPVGQRACRAPDTSSVITLQDDYVWHDRHWFAQSGRTAPLRSPVNIYELHLGSWRRKEDGSLYSYAELAPILAEYVRSMGYTHVELMPLSEYPYGPSWGYQVTHFYAPTSRYGTPRELKILVDTLHQAGIGVILDWVGSHFPKDECGLYEFDGSCTYELSDPAMNEHPRWGTRIFDLSKPEVRSFLISNAVYWLEVFHMDGLRLSAACNMLYLDHERQDYTPNRYGGRENLSGIDFLKKLNRACSRVRRNVIMATEETVSFPMVTAPDFDGGLGFLFKWSPGWTDTTLDYMSEDPIFRKCKHTPLVESIRHCFTENHILPLSHDAVISGKGSLISRMPGEYAQKFANLRLLRGFQMVCPGKKLSFMGNEFGQFIEWNFRQGLDWLLLEYDMHQKLQTYTRELNRFYRDNAPLWSQDDSPCGFAWILADDADESLLAFRRIGSDGRELLCVLNFTPVARPQLRLGVPRSGVYAPVFCSDETRYGGSGLTPCETASEPVPCCGCADSCIFSIPPLSLTVFSRKPD